MYTLLKFQNPALAQLEEHLTVEVTWKSRGPWFKSGKPDFFSIYNYKVKLLDY